MDEKKHAEDNAFIIKLKLHFLYTVLILILIIVGIITFHSFDNRDTFNAVSFSSAVISIILAVLTIVYSYYLNSRSSGQIETLNNAARDVSGATQEYSKSAETLHNNINRIVAAVDRIEVKADKLVNDSLINSENSQNSTEKFDEETYIKRYILLSSEIGIIAMYACILSKINNKSFTLSLIGEDKIQMYAAGFLISTFCTGIIIGNIDFNTLTVTGGEYDITAKKTIDEWVSKNGENNAIKDIKTLIDNYFDIP